MIGPDDTFSEIPRREFDDRPIRPAKEYAWDQIFEEEEDQFEEEEVKTNLMKNNDNAIIPAARLSKPIDFGTVDDTDWDNYLEN